MLDKDMVSAFMDSEFIHFAVLLCLGGDFTQFNGRGGESIYGEKLADEK